MQLVLQNFEITMFPILYIRAWYDKIKLLWRPKNVSRLVILKTSSFWKTLHKFYSRNHIISWKYT